MSPRHTRVGRQDEGDFGAECWRVGVAKVTGELAHAPELTSAQAAP